MKTLFVLLDKEIRQFFSECVLAEVGDCFPCNGDIDYSVGNDDGCAAYRRFGSR